MKFEIRCREMDSDKYPEVNPKSEGAIFVEFDSDWFLNTTPSINDTKEFVPEWEDATNFDTVFLFFLAEYSQELLKTNNNILCKEAKQALQLINSITFAKTIDKNIIENNSKKYVPF